MTFNERKIIKYLRDGEGRMHIQIIAQRTGIGSDYARLLCRSLERGGYLKFADINVCYLLTRGRSRFSAPEERDLDSGGQDSGSMVETAEPDAIVNPEIIVETISTSISEKEEPPSEEKSEEEELDHVLAEIDGKKEEPELIDEEDQKLDEIQSEILKEVEAEQEEGEEILEETLKEGWLSKLRKSIWKKWYGINRVIKKTSPRTFYGLYEVRGKS